jgi:hypothetical protein
MNRRRNESGAMMTMTMEHSNLMEAGGPTGRRADDECQTSAGDFLRSLIGAAPDDLLWDDIHHLQGHAHCSGREIIVIASRDSSHHPLVLTLADWETIRRADSSERGALLRTCAIDSHTRLLEALAAA